MNLSDLSVSHDYYCSDTNYHCKNACQEYNTFQEFYKEFKGVDVDYNLIFRWDILEYKDEETEEIKHTMSIFVIKQRQGIFMPIHIQNVYESDVEDIVSLLTKHHNKLKNLWQPFK